MFSYRGEHSFLDYYGVEPGTFSGVAHADEMFYLFDPLYSVDLGDMLEADKNVRDMFVSFWTNFAKFGDPTPPGSAVSWAPVDAGSRMYLNISGTDPVMQRSENYEARMQFWTSVVNIK